MGLLQRRPEWIATCRTLARLAGAGHSCQRAMRWIITADGVVARVGNQHLAIALDPDVFGAVQRAFKSLAILKGAGLASASVNLKFKLN